MNSRPAPFDELDRKIITALMANARTSFAEIGAAVGLSSTAVKRRVDRLEASGVIRGYTTVVDPAASGWHTEAFVYLYCDGRMPADAIKAAVDGEPQVASAHTVAGEYSAVLHVLAKDTADLELALERIRATEGVSRTVSQIVLSTLFQR